MIARPYSPVRKRIFGLATASVLVTAGVFGVTTAAFAAPGVVVTPDDIVAGTPWSVGFQDGTATWSIVPDSDHFFGDDALQLITPATADAVGLWHDLDISLADFTMHYSTKQLSAQSYALPGIFAYIELNNTAVFGANAYIYAGYEPAYNNPGALDTKQWQTWTVSQTSNVWVPGSAFTSSGRYGTFTVPFSTLTADADLSNARVMGVYLNQGTGNEGWGTLLDRVNLGGEATYNFELAPTPSPTPSPTGEVDNSLASTGSDSAPMFFGGVVLIALGAVLIGFMTRRRKAL